MSFAVRPIGLFTPAFVAALGFVPNEPILADATGSANTQLLSNGQILYDGTNAGPSSYLTPVGDGNGAPFEARVFLTSLSSGVFTMSGVGVAVGTFSPWYGLEATRIAEVARNSGSRADAIGTIYIRNKTTLEEISVPFDMVGDN